MLRRHFLDGEWDAELRGRAAVQRPQNGLIGYYGVNKNAGQVVELNSPESQVHGSELSRLQAQLRSKHCVGQGLVRKSSMPLER